MIESSRMHTIIAGIDPLIRPLIPFFAELTSERIEQLKDSTKLGIEASDPIKRLAHTIKGSAASYGFPEFAELAVRIEVAIQMGDFQSVKQLVLELETKHAELHTTIVESPELFVEQNDDTP